MCGPLFVAGHNVGYNLLWFEFLHQLHVAPLHVQQQVRQCFVWRGSHEVMCTDTYIEKLNRFIKQRCKAFSVDMSNKVHRACERAKLFFKKKGDYRFKKTRLRQQQKFLFVTIQWMMQSHFTLNQPNAISNTPEKSRNSTSQSNQLKMNYQWAEVLRSDLEQTAVNENILIPRLLAYFRTYYEPSSNRYLHEKRRYKTDV